MFNQIIKDKDQLAVNEPSNAERKPGILIGDLSRELFDGDLSDAELSAICGGSAIDDMKASFNAAVKATATVTHVSTVGNRILR